MLWSWHWDFWWLQYSFKTVLALLFFQVGRFFKIFYLFVFGCTGFCCSWAFSRCGKRGLLFLMVPGFSLQGLLITVASLIAEHGLYDVRASVVESPRLQKVEWVVVHGLSCPVACGTFSDQGSNLCPLHWKTDSSTRPPGKSILPLLEG